jgi:zinc/manganese transport system permease protein
VIPLPHHLDIIGIPLLAGLLVIATHVPLGREVLRRGIIFIDLAIAQIAGLGVLAALLLGQEPGGWLTQLIAIASALLGAMLIRGFERRWPEHQEALIGVTFVMAATGTLLLLSGHPHGAEQLETLLAGQLLWVDGAQLRMVAVVYLAVLLAWYLGGTGGMRFYLLFGVTVTVSVQLAGVYLVFSCLIIPALAVHRLRGVVALVAGYVLGMAAFVLGLLCSLWLDTPAGPTVVWALALLGIVLATAGRRLAGTAGSGVS